MNENQSDYIMFLTDDSEFFRNIYVPQSSFELIFGNPDKYSFSLGHGANIAGGNYILKESILAGIFMRNRFIRNGVILFRLMDISIVKE